MKVKRYFSETIGISKPTEYSQDFTEIETLFNSYYNLYKDLSKNCKQMMYPNNPRRIIMNATNTLKISKGNKYYSHPETLLSENCLKYANILSDFPLSKALLDISETYKK